MKKYKGAVFFDYDGTLVDEVDHIKTVTPKTLEAIRRLQDNGYAALADQTVFRGGYRAF